MRERLITTPFGPRNTAAEVITGIDLSDRRGIVTGGSSGIGVETARALAAAGAEVTLAVRDTAAGEAVAADIAASTGRPAPLVGRLDLADQGAAPSVLLAACPLLEGVTGRYFEDCAEAGPHQPGIRRGVAPFALDPENAARLWQVSLDLLAAT